MSFPPVNPSGPIPAQRFYHDPVLFDRIQRLETEVQRLSGHVKMVEIELQNEKRRSNQRDGRASKRRKLNVEARALTSAEGMKLAAEKDAERIAKAQKKKESERRRKEKEVARDQQRQARPPDQPFSGSLASKNKGDLQEIAAALNLSEDGTKDALVLRINAYFDSNPLERETPRFSGLFHRGILREW
jgi:catalase